MKAKDGLGTLKKAALLAVVIPVAIGALGMTCAEGAKKVASIPRVQFNKIPGAIMYLTRGSGALRVRFDGKIREFPLTCEYQGALIRTRGSAASVKYEMKKLSMQPGWMRVQFHDKKGKLIFKGRLCVFPTYETRLKSIRKRYTIKIPIKAIMRRPEGRSAVLFQTYPPARVSTDPNLNHVAWVLYIEP